MTIAGPLGVSFASTIRRNRTLYRWFKPLSDWYANVAGHRKVGLKYDDLLVEERPDVERAIARLTPREQFDRAFRFKRASQCSVLHDNLPKDQWIKPEEDVRYLKPHVVDVVKEDLERAKWDNIEVKRTR
ncbi:ubiquinol-cytochrome-c reductase complex subunit 6 [Lentinus tigrinus ALCF2SS1-7]|uniref:Complex III subunit 7 n=1 Tax=Lentinus tigrinus ALCF2SS1-6 TaxID=1328759 RepID=A0A5C2SYR7_9APHY|nr:ubiquinol-cytochrome-c reductase complex subunit 6 [Lentinus tigrinus ALCF2SS1-6]RPD79831.1 ubiquinol-cytochrome-c reductase complex subunit 6 [Lentinus tigrinus ALCF2SS1-7]